MLIRRKTFYNSLSKKIHDSVNEKKLQPKRISFNDSDSKPPTPIEIVWIFINYAILLFWSLIVLFPIVSLIISAFNVQNTRIISIYPFKFGLDNFKYLFYNERSLFLTWYKNTIIIAVLTMIISTVFVALNGYAYSRFKFAGSKHSLTIIMLLQMIPATSSLICLYILVGLGESIGIDPKIMLVLIYSGGAVASNTFMLKSYLDTLSTELDDSGKVDGCSNWGLFFKILVPVIRPALIMVALWSFLTPFTDVILPKFVLRTQSERTLAVGLDTFLNTDPKYVNAGAYGAGSILASLPAFCLFMYLQRYIVGGLSDGAVKG
ncbi:sugar ABC transporter permease [Mycoplasmopsis anatis]|uniref:Maltodextrin ABC transporter, permease MalD n=2 Tax=Mycoplasmopsis anatis TaxID=171279 RepID=F9QCQ0_9BACT|nr:sugar ABC transporter permease [Mycoplasmopsis anatis]AWX70021.1 sugar ABC transporter permease [Mycoplasmopsis anatis]EGS29467.1 Maltodextrin ABC transporter, permease MalD [Mycoplasmopsis anatis 1340]MBW0594487.1 sugar ABC transporter permease [Mycoplasmopsis anatis]MBW0595224.1 sugar ABC transporter permease [Mycoplasmopsis anatis]MBW0596423.1 sugar ABC transporter permease [Mycoplasmopsis anatis]